MKFRWKFEFPDRHRRRENGVRSFVRSAFNDQRWFVDQCSTFGNGSCCQLIVQRRMASWILSDVLFRPFQTTRFLNEKFFRSRCRRSIDRMFLCYDSQRSHGPMVKAPAYGAGDSRFESWCDRLAFLLVLFRRLDTMQNRSRSRRKECTREFSFFFSSNVRFSEHRNGDEKNLNGSLSYEPWCFVLQEKRAIVFFPKKNFLDGKLNFSRSNFFRMNDGKFWET